MDRHPGSGELGRLRDVLNAPEQKSHPVRMKTIDTSKLISKRRLPKLMACMTRASLEHMRIEQMQNTELLSSRNVRRMRRPLHECMVLEQAEDGLSEASEYLRDLIEDNIKLVEADELGIVVDLRKRTDYLEHLNSHLRKAVEKRNEGNMKEEALLFVDEANYFANREKGILWLAEKLYLAAIAIASKYYIDGGRLKGCCCYFYAKFLLDKFPGADTTDSYELLLLVRNAAAGKPWLLWEPEQKSHDTKETLLHAACIQLHRVLLMECRAKRATDPNKSETLARLAERRAEDAKNKRKISEAILEIGICQLFMNNLNNAQKSFERAYDMFEKANDIEGQCEAKMHLAAVMQRKFEYDVAVKLLTDMGLLALKKNLTRQLGRALHFLGELYLRQDRPELGTVHLLEAFWCFMGTVDPFHGMENVTSHDEDNRIKDDTESVKENIKPSALSVHNIYKDVKRSEKYLEEAEQSRLMVAVSEGQEYMASYFAILREVKVCSIATVKVIEWKLSKMGWWVERKHHKYLPCLCPRHNRSPLDVLWAQIKATEEAKADYIDMSKSVVMERETEHHENLGRISDAESIGQ